MLSLDWTPLEFVLPPTLEAHAPAEARGLARDQVRLLVSQCGGRWVDHRIFSDLPDVLRPGDLLVANDSATLPAAITATRPDGSAIDVHLSTQLPADLWVVEPRHVNARPGDVLRLPEGATLSLLAPYPRSRRLWVGWFDVDAAALFARHGRPIAYPYVRGEWPIAAYQTVYAARVGSAEMPSAGRAFSPDVLERLAHRGIEFETLTLHAGVASLEGDEPPYAEQYWVPARTARAVESARAAGRRVIAVGTTVVRALESAAEAGGGTVIASHGWTELVITPARGVRTIDGLLTGLHEPRASHLAMLEAIAGRAHLERAYRAALDEQYLWHEFGDLHLIL